MNRRGFLKAAVGLAVVPAAAKVEPLVGWAGSFTFNGVPIVFDTYSVEPAAPIVEAAAYKWVQYGYAIVQEGDSVVVRRI